MPVIDGTSLVALVSDYEQSRDYGLPGFYCGYDAEYVDNVFRYRQDDFGYYQGRHVELLSCNGCFEAGCWPLEANIVVGPTTVVWRDFRQPHRRDRRYAGFGPFEFDRGGYMSAMSSLKTRVADLADQMASGRATPRLEASDPELLHNRTHLPRSGSTRPAAQRLERWVILRRRMGDT